MHCIYRGGSPFDAENVLKWINRRRNSKDFMIRFPRYRWPDLPRLAGLAFLYALLAKIILTYFPDNGAIAIIWPSSGVALAALLIGGKKYWPGVFIGSLAGDILAGSSMGVSASIAAGNTLESLSGAWLLARSDHFDPSLRHPRSLRLLLLACVLSTAVSAINGAVTLLLAGYLTRQTFAVNLLHWWMGNALGIILFTPLIMIWRQIPQEWFRREHAAELAAFFVLSFLCGQVVFLDWFHESIGLVARGYWMFLFAVWGAARFGRHGISLVIAMTLVQALAGSALGVGFFATDLAQTGFTNFWFYMVTLAVVGMPLAAIIFERRQASEELRESEFRWKFALEGAGDGVWDWDMQTGKVIFSGRYKEMLGYAKDEAWSSLDEWKSRVNGEDMHYAMQELEAYLDGKRAIYTAEYRMQCRDGEWKWMLVRGMVVRRTADGRPLRMIGTHTDISKIREAEQHAQDLLRQNRALTRRMFTVQEKERRHLASELHDELGQWLTAIQTEAHVINRIAGGTSPIHNSVQAISESASAMHEVIQRMVHDLRPSLLDSLGLVDSLRELEKQWCQPHLGVACDFTLEDNLGDLGENLNITIYRLVQEALNNAAKYAQASRVLVQLQRVAEEPADAGFISLNIADDGMGFDPGQPTRGAGILGMRERVIVAGGEFDLYSAPGQGVRISARLPLRQIGENHERRKA